jgi:hypothetical protein
MRGFLRPIAPTNLLYGMAILSSPQKTPTGERPYHDLHGMLMNNQKTADRYCSNIIQAKNFNKLSDPQLSCLPQIPTTA